MGRGKQFGLTFLCCTVTRPTLTCLTTVEQEIVSEIKKTRYKEISERKLQNMCAVRPSSSGGSNAPQASSSKGTRGNRSALLRDSPFPLSYHLLDLEGRGVIYKVAAPATNDYIVRLRS
jgi:hypothetical protein